jgi:hypothetical protein
VPSLVVAFYAMATLNIPVAHLYALLDQLGTPGLPLVREAATER